MNQRRRTRICMRVVMLGLLNVAGYTVAYAFVGGDAWNGAVEDGVYYVGGHFLHSVEGHRTPVSKDVWLYSYVHSITIWPSLAAIALGMLVLARPHILATYRGGVVSGRTLIAIIATIVVVICVSGMFVFCRHLFSVLAQSA